MRIPPWRVGFIAGGVLCAVGGGMHPRGASMATMLADPAWVPGHSMLLAGLAVVTYSLLRFTRTHDLPPRARLWARLAIAGVALEAIEMAVHTAAALDAANLAAGLPTPVFTTHMAIAMVAYPFFGVTVAGFIAATAAARVLGSRWLAPLGMIGALAYGFAPLLTSLFPDAGLGILFPMFLLFALWLLLTGLLPARRAAVAS